MTTSAASLVSLVLALSGVAATASEEGILPLSTFRLSSNGNAQSGPVTVYGEQSAKGLSSLRIEAFGRRMLLSNEQLAKVSGGSVNGAQISYEVGYTKGGGRTVYVVLSSGHTRGAPIVHVISANEQGGVEVANAVRKQGG